MKLADRVLDLLYPPRCAFCQELLAGGWRGCCKSCLDELPFVPSQMQSQSFPHIDKCVSPLYYKDIVRDSLHRYKFQSKTAYAEIYSCFMAKSIDENAVSCDIITWVPLSRKRKRCRGYDQAELLARDIAKIKALPCRRLLKKLRDTKPQSSTGGKEKRKANIKGAYAPVDPQYIKDKRILLVDDIVTTGSTLSEAAKMLRAAGAAAVCCATLARSQP